MVSFNSRVSLLIFFYLDYLSIGDEVLLTFSTSTILGSVYVFKYSSVCLMKLDIPTLGKFKLMIVISSTCI
jgi:hypothetical protein